MLHFNRPGWYVSARFRFEAEHTGPNGSWEVSDNLGGRGALFVTVPSLRVAERWCEERAISEFLG